MKAQNSETHDLVNIINDHAKFQLDQDRIVTQNCSDTIVTLKYGHGHFGIHHIYGVWEYRSQSFQNARTLNQPGSQTLTTTHSHYFM